MSYAQEAHVPASHVQTANRRPTELSTRAGLSLLLLLALLHGTLYALFLPPWGLIDEAQHFHYIQYIAEQQALPVAGDLYLSAEIIDSHFATRRWQTFHWTPPAAPDPAVMGLEGHSYEAYQPPLYYVLMTPIYWAFPQDTLLKVYGLRLVAVLLSLITVWALYRTVRFLMPQYPQLPFLAGLLLVAIPERAMATSRINNDVLLEIMAALFFLALTHAAIAGLTVRRGLLLGLLLGLAAWVKIPAALLALPLLIFLWVRRRELTWAQRASWLWGAAPLGAALAARNLWLYGDLTGFAAFDQLHRLAPVDTSGAGFLRALTSIPNHLWVVWWKGSDVGVNPLVTGFYLLMALIVAASGGRLLLYWWRQRYSRVWDAKFLVALLYSVTILLYAAAVMASYYRGMVPVIQGRFLLPAIVPIVVLLAVGLWLYPRGEKLMLAVVVLLWGMSVFSLFGNLIPYFYYWSDVVQGVISGRETLGIWQRLAYIYQRSLFDKPPLLAPLLIILPIGYGVAHLLTLVLTLRVIHPPRRWFPEGTLPPANNAPRPPDILSRHLVKPALKMENLVGFLLPASVFYLALPHLIFYIGWLQWPFALLTSVIVVMALVNISKLVTNALSPEAQQEDATGEHVLDDPVTTPALAPVSKAKNLSASAFSFTHRHLLMIGAVGLVWLILAGIGGVIRQDYDWDKHNVMLNSLILKPWPTVYEIYQEKVPLVYYIGYYLPSAIAGKLTGWIGANVMLFVWSLSGLLLAFLWFCILVRRVSYSVLLIFVFFSGLDVLGTRVAVLAGIWTTVKAAWKHIDSWAGVWQYSSNTTLLFWVPHHALSGWIMTAITIYCLVILRRRDLILLPVGLSAFWSPFVTIGILPYLIIDFLVDQAALWRRIRPMISLPNLAGVLAIGMTVFYLSARFYESSPVIIYNTVSEWSLPTFEGPLLVALLLLISFCLVEFGIYALILYASGAVQDKRWRWMLHITVFTLCLLPWFKYGAFNDLVMRASIPALFVLAVIMTQVIHDGQTAAWARGALVTLLLAGAVTPAVEIARHLERMWNYPPPLVDATQAPRTFVDYFATEAFFFGQYTGGLESPFFAYVAKAEPTNAATEPELAINQHDYILYDNKIYLVRDEIDLAEEAEIVPGATVTVPLPLDFYGLAIRAEYNLDARLVGEGDNVIWQIEEWPAGRPAIDALDITPWTGTMTMTIPTTATLGIYQLEIGFYDVNTKEYLIARSVPDELPLGEVVPVASLEVKGN